jgi:hypothetical protein
MELKELIKGTLQGTGEVTESLMSVVSDIIKEGTHDVSEIFGVVIELGKEGAIDVTGGVKGVFVGSVNALKESGKSSEDAVTEVTTKAEQAIGSIGETGEETVGNAAKKGVEEAKAIVSKPFEN